MMNTDELQVCKHCKKTRGTKMEQNNGEKIVEEEKEEEPEKNDETDELDLDDELTN